MKKRHCFWVALIIVAVGCRTGYAAVVDVTDGKHWAQVCENGVTLQWDKSWVSDDSVAAHLSITGMSVRLSETLDPDAGAYTWNVQLGDAEEDVCEVRLSFVDAQGHSLGVLEARLAVSKSAFMKTNVRAADDAAWQKVKSDVLIPWNAAWLASPDACTQVSLQWTNAQTVAVSSDATFGFYPFSYVGRPKGKYDLTLSFLNEAGASVEEPFLATLFLVVRGSLISLK